MQVRWMMAPWMRRRIARSIERGSSERVIACLVASPGHLSSQEGREPLARRDGQVDLSNVILFRALAGRETRPDPGMH